MKTGMRFRLRFLDFLSAARAPRLPPEPTDPRHPRRVFFLFASLFVLVAFPAHAQPAPPGGRVLLYPEPHFRGDPLVVEVGGVVENLEYVRNPRGRKWNDRVSSVRLEGPLLLVMYEDANFRGAQATLTRDASDLAALPVGDRHGTSWDKRISSFRVEAIYRNVGPPFIRWDRRDAERAVRSAYRDLLEREPDDRGLREYRDRLMDRGWTESQLRDALRQSDEFRHRDFSSIIRRVYREVLRRDPDRVGAASYTKALQSGMSEAEFRVDLRRSREYAELQAREAVDRAYRDILRRAPDPAGLATYVKRMVDQGWDEGRVREALRQSDEYRRLPRR